MNSKLLKKFSDKSFLNSITLGIIVAGLAIGLSLIYINQKKSLTNITEPLTPQQAAQKAIGFINENMLVDGVSASLIDAIEQNGVYQIKFKVEEEEFESYVSPDGKLLFVQGIDLENGSSDDEGGNQEIVKTDIPDVKLFVMSYCPYGLQAQKALLPVYDLLEDKTDIGVYFVSYIMHDKKEIDENLRQYCIQKEEDGKYVDYLSCFVKDGNYEECLSNTGIDQGKIGSCISATDQEYGITEKYNDESTWLSGKYPKFDVHAAFNEEYKVTGSPTLVVNGVTILSREPNPNSAPQKYIVIPDFSRSPEGYKNIICQAFNSAPEECSQTLLEETPQPSFGMGTGGSGSGSCQ